MGRGRVLHDRAIRNCVSCHLLSDAHRAASFQVSLCLHCMHCAQGVETGKQQSGWNPSRRFVHPEQPLRSGCVPQPSECLRGFLGDSLLFEVRVLASSRSIHCKAAPCPLPALRLWFGLHKIRQSPRKCIRLGGTISAVLFCTGASVAHRPVRQRFHRFARRRQRLKISHVRRRLLLYYAK